MDVAMARKKLKKRRGPLPTERSLGLLRRRGWIVGNAERWNPVLKRRHDLFGFIDLVAMRPLPPMPSWRAGPAAQTGGILGVQATVADHFAKRVAKVLAESRAKVWLGAGGRIVVHAWGLKGRRGARKLWECTEREITLSDFTEETQDGNAHVRSLPG